MRQQVRNYRKIHHAQETEKRKPEEKAPAYFNLLESRTIRPNENQPDIRYDL
jgi:hypothetical protein